MSTSHFPSISTKSGPKQLSHLFTDDDDTLLDDPEDEIRSQKKDLVAEIPRHEDLGWPLIPPQGDLTLRESKSVLRAYVTATYRKLSLCFTFSYKKINMLQVTILITRWHQSHGPCCRQMQTSNTFLPSPSLRG